MVARLYCDAHVPVAIPAGLARRGLDVLTAQADDRSKVSDEELLIRCLETGRLLLTQDADFFSLTSRWRSAGRVFPTVIFAHQLGPGIGQIIDDVELLLHGLHEDEWQGHLFRIPIT